MNEESFVRNEVHSEPVTHALDIGGGAGEETPVFWVGLPGFCVVTQDLGLIADRVEGDGEQDQVFSQAVLKSFLEHAKVIRRAKAVFGQGASGVDKVQGNHFAGELAEVNCAFLLIREREIRDGPTYSQLVQRSAQSLVETLQAAGLGRFSLGAVVAPDPHIFCVRGILVYDQGEIDNGSAS